MSEEAASEHVDYREIDHVSELELNVDNMANPICLGSKVGVFRPLKKI